MVRKISQEPDDHRADEDDAAHLLQILTAFLPCMTEDGLCGRNSVRRKLHHERQVVILEERTHDLGRKHSQHDAQGIQSQKHQTGMTREEGSGNEHIDRHSSRTGHQRYDKHSDETALAAFDGPCRHHCRHVAAESHDHRYE